MKKLGILFLFTILLLLTGCSESLKTVKEDVKKEISIEGVEIASALLNELYEEVYNQFSPELSELITLKDFKALGKEFTSDESTFELVSSYTLSDYESYIWHNANKTKGILAYVNQENIIVAFQVLDLEAYPETDTLFSTIQYQLPFHDEWFVYWGGHDVMTNYHYAHETNRYAYDFVKVVDGSTYKGDPLENESYFAFNQDIVAPAKGIVVAVVDGIADNMPGVLNSSQPEGNMVVIEHEHGEYSILAHFKQHSIVVKVGDEVEAGQLLGKCGNSGNSSEAHLHYQVNKKMADGAQLVIPITFNSGQSYIKGDIVSN